MAEHGDKIPAADKEAIEKDIQSLKDALGSEDAEKIEQQLQALTQSSMKLGEFLYKAEQEKAAAAGAGAPSGNDNAANDSDVVDATFEEVDEKKKNG